MNEINTNRLRRRIYDNVFFILSNGSWLMSGKKKGKKEMNK